ncbi:FecR family protein [uncultured Bacteroides sp.]|uniref:FecR family protein n=1 Tax=uncultured Bacteroides sp. TaxID=162156 RepID=UPI0025EB211D|nr:FecR domain-containing protein [uncultured Bacteroides sp.]
MQKENAWTRIAASGNVMEYMLPDSTFVTLSPHSTLKYRSDRFGTGQREVEMTGKAYFRVYRDATHPFCVTGQYAVVKVLGTKFQIEESLSDSATQVYISSGKVLFAAKGEDDGMILTKDMQASLLHGEQQPRMVASQIPNPAAWAVGKFVYEETPLPDVLKELSDYYQVELTTAGTDKTLSAEFETSDGLDVIVSLIEKTLEIRIEKK